MASSNFFLALIPLLLLLSLSISITTNAQEPAAKEIAVVVEGVVYCQSCDTYGTSSLTGAKPINDSTVRVICEDRENNVSFDKTFDTDANGYFYAELKGFKMGNRPLESCKVKLVWSPLKTCNVITEVHYDQPNGGAPLRDEGKRVNGTDYEAVVYSVGPLAFGPNGCPPKAKAEAEPQTTEQAETGAETQTKQGPKIKLDIIG